MSLRSLSRFSAVRWSLVVATGMGLSTLGLAQSRATRPMPSPPPSRPMERPMDRPVFREMDRPRPMERREVDPPQRSTERPADRPQPRAEAAPATRHDPAPYPRPAEARVIEARPLPRCTVIPNREYWERRDIMAEIQWMARRGSIHVHPVAEDANSFEGSSVFPAGWTAYGFVVPAGESLKVSLDHPNRGWFRLAMTNKWGQLEQGMLQNVLHTYEPVVTYTNPTKETRAVYVIVDDPGWMSQGNPFTMSITRSWEPGKKKVDDTPIVTGIWAKK